MTSPKAVNIAASIKGRLLNLARTTNRPYQELLQYFGMERFLYRLSRSSHSKRFILKGALLFHVWKIQESRATRDIDVLAMADNSKENIESLIRDICDLEVDCLDGIVFDSNSLSIKIMQNQREYEGIRVCFQGYLENTKISMQLDIGFGDRITPAPVEITYPTLLDLPMPKLCGYPVETVIAEKLHTMVEKGMLNSRVKDYHDVWVLLRQGHYDGEVLERAVERTFSQRGIKFERTELFQIIKRYGFAPDRQSLWDQYIRKGAYMSVSRNLSQVCADISTTLQFLLAESMKSPVSNKIGIILGQRNLKGRNLLEKVNQLIISGADVNDTSNNGHLPLNIAISRGCREVAFLLLEAGADFQVQDNSGLNAFELALNCARYDVAYDIYKRGFPYQPRHFNQRLKISHQNQYEFDLRYFS